MTTSIQHRPSIQTDLPPTLERRPSISDRLKAAVSRCWPKPDESSLYKPLTEKEEEQLFYQQRRDSTGS
ncbi:MAG: hypothetical protein KGJ02_01510 [Verrucomicrobiota bacterium]|nr:hypothetical protein [Verrucomicrobiota bacterium]